MYVGTFMYLCAGIYFKSSAKLPYSYFFEVPNTLVIYHGYTHLYPLKINFKCDNLLSD